MKYYVKTRNWNCDKRVKKLLDISLKFGAQRGDSYEDEDGKYYFESDSLVKCFAILAYYLTLRRFSGGWTYLKRNASEKEMGNYGILYL